MDRVATIVITTRNRKAELRRAIASSLVQTAPVEILVIDDGSSDRTAEMIQTEYPDARLICHSESKGYIVRRNEAARLASADIIISIDDDAWFSSPNIVSSIIDQFEHPRIAAVAIPFIDLHKDPHRIYQIAPNKIQPWR